MPLIHDGVWHWAQATPEATAVAGSRETLSYAALALRAGKLARALQELGFSHGARAGILMEGSVECCEAMLGCLRAGGCYLPLSAGSPPHRLAAVMRSAEPEVVFTLERHYSLLVRTLTLSKTAPKAIFILDGPDSFSPEDSPAPCRVVLARDLAGLPEPGPCPAIAQDLAYILYTSGSTGEPKGVMVRHSNVRAYLGWMARQFAITPADRFSGHASPTFDISVHDIFGAFFSGASVHPLETPAQKAFPGPFITSRAITCWNSVPSVISMLVKSRQLTPGAFPSLRLATFAGEALPPSLARAWLEALPHCDLCNNYGPTETTIVCTWHKVERVDNGKPIPIGRAIPGNQCMVLSRDDMRPVEPGTPGRLFVRGAQVSAGYWRRPDLTVAAYLENPMQPEIGDVVYDTGDLACMDAEGMIHYLGRADDQVKIRGHRIELGDVEAALSGLPGVMEATVLAVPGGDALELVACVSGPGLPRDNSEILLNELAGLLPPYMMPGRMVFFPELPRTANGKTDKKALQSLLEEEEKEKE
jgi:amino acid adenylation domain-containing protein